MMLRNLTRSRKAKGCLFIMGSLFVLCCACSFVVGRLAEPFVAPFIEVVAPFNAGLSYYEEKQYDKALYQFKKAITAIQKLKTQSKSPSTPAELQVIEGMLLSMMGTIYYQQGEYKQAVDVYEQSRAIFAKTTLDDQTLALFLKITGGNVSEGYGDNPLLDAEIRTFNNLGAVYLSMGRYQQAIESFEEVLAIEEEVGNRTGEGIALNNIGNVYHFWGQYQQALATHFEALEIHREVGNRQDEATTLNGIGLTYNNLGQYEPALEYMTQAVAIAQDLNNEASKAPKLNNMGIVSLHLGQHQKALDYFEQALAIYQESDSSEQGTALDNIGATYLIMAQYDKALDYHQQALEIFRDVGNTAKEASALHNIGSVYDEQELFEDALDYHQQALTLTQQIGAQQAQMVTLSDIGYVYERQGDTTQAIIFYQQAADVLESIQSEVKVEELKTSFISETVDVYEHLIGLLWAEERSREAFNAVERARARAFLDQQANGLVDYRAGNDAALLQEEQRLRDEITATRAQLFALRNRLVNEWDQEVIAATNNELEALEQEYSRFLSELKIQSPEVASLVSVDVASLAEIQSDIPADTTLVEYFVLDEQTLAFVITQDSFQSVTLNVSREELAATIKNFQLLDLANLEAGDDENLQQLHTWLIAELLPNLNSPKLVIIPHKDLHYLPFAALTDGQRYLSDDYQLSILPSASVLRFMRQKRKPESNTILALGNPLTEVPGLKAIPVNEAFLSNK